MDESLNVFGETLEGCSDDPKTGFFRDGCCNTSDDDPGSHTVCVELTREFLEFSRFRGNDLSTPRPEFGFPGLGPGDRWCLCAARWLEAHENGRAPRVKPIGGLFGSVAVSFAAPLMPVTLGFAAGAMLFVISDEIIPETHRGELKRLATFALLGGFVIMMYLDATLG